MAQLIPQEIIENIRTETNIVDVVGQYVQLKKSGKNYLGLCPFHNEKTPSFSVAEDKQIFHCFGCGKGGNVFSFVQEIEGLSFPEAVSKVAEESEIDISEYFNVENYSLTASQTSTQNKTNQMIVLHEEAAKFYHHVLINTKVGEKALTYLKDRGLTLETIEKFQLGFAPIERQVLKQVLEGKEFDSELLKSSGLFYELENGTILDRFYQRIMFPIANNQGKIIGFSGRLLVDEQFDLSDQPKYLNSPETDIFNKRFILYNYHRARPMIRKTNEVFLFEGFMDVISADQSGVENGVASMGTSLTLEQIKMLERITKNVLVCYDGDNAGIEATYRALDLIQKQSQLTCQVVSIPYKLDPDDYRKKYGETELKNLLDTSRETVFQFRKLFFKRNRNFEIETDKLEYIEDLLNALVDVPSVIETDMALTQLADEFAVSKETLQNDLRQKQQKERNKRNQGIYQDHRKEVVIPQQREVRYIEQVEKAERLLLYRLLTERSFLPRLKEVENFAFYHDVYQELYTHIMSYFSSYGQVTIAEMFDYLKEDYLKSLLTEITMAIYSEESSEQELSDCLKVIKQERITHKIKKKLLEQKEAVKVGNKQLEFEMMIAIIQLQKELKNIS